MKVTMRAFAVLLLACYLPSFSFAGVFDNSPTESKDDYKASCRIVDNAIYNKLKKGSDLLGARVKFEATVISIDRAYNVDAKYKKKTLRVHIAGHRDIFVVEYYGELDIYEGAEVYIYGEGDAPLYVGKNQEYPRILAKYIERLK